MSLFELSALLLVAALCGSIGQALAGVSRGGCLMAVVLGFIGALLGRWLSGILALPDLFVVDLGGKSFPVIWSVIGAAVFVAFLNAFTGGRPR